MVLHEVFKKNESKNVSSVKRDTSDMERKLNRLIRFFVVAIFIGGLFGDVIVVTKVSAQPTTWTVDDDGPADFNTIGEAIEAASLGDNIVVMSGVYREKIVISKNGLSLIGEDANSTIIDGERKNTTIVDVQAGDVLISGFTIQNSGFPASGLLSAGIRVLGYANITGNIIKRNKIGIHVNSRCVIKRNKLLYNGHGVSMVFVSSATVEENFFLANTMGISLTGSVNNSIVRNHIARSVWGGHGIVLLQNSMYNNVSENLLQGNSHGMWLSGSSDNLIFGNTVADCGILGIELTDSPNNTLHHNNFINNTKHIVVNTPNTWNLDPPVGGNFWDNFNGTDMDGDGFGDSSHRIDSNNEDRFPLITPRVWNYSNAVPVVWAGRVYWVKICSNSTVDGFYFTQPLTQISYSLQGPQGTTGYCNVTIPKELLNGDPWHVEIDDEQPKTLVVGSNSSYSFLYFSYNHTYGTSIVVIHGTSAIPEYKFITIVLSVIILSATLAVLAKRLKLKLSIN